MIALDYGVWLITRAEWGARAPRGVTRLASSAVTSHWGGPGFPGDDWPHESCYSKVRGWQNFHMDSNGWADLAYNAVACQHRFVFEGRGRGVRSAANGTTAGNGGAYAICYLGGIGDPFDEDAKAAMKAGGNWLTFAGSNRNGHRDWKATACPGDEIYQWTAAGQPIAFPPPVPKDWFDMATQADLEDVVRRLGPWLGLVDGDPSGAHFIFHGGTRTWMGSQEAVLVQRDYFRNLHTDGGRPFTPTLLEARGFHLVNRAELEAHLGHPYEF